MRELFQATGLGEPAEFDGEGVFSDRTSADVGLLVGEQHLRQGEYLLALEAFTRSLQTSPTPDAYEGRARAYRGLADEDERRASELR